METTSLLIVLLLFAANLMLASIMWALGTINESIRVRGAQNDKNHADLFVLIRESQEK